MTAVKADNSRLTFSFPAPAGVLAEVVTVNCQGQSASRNANIAQGVAHGVSVHDYDSTNCYLAYGCKDASKTYWLGNRQPGSNQFQCGWNELCSGDDWVSFWSAYCVCGLPESTVLAARAEPTPFAA